MTLKTSFAHDESEGNAWRFDRSQPLRFDPTQFRLQADGTFRVSIRAMASMAGVDQSGLARSLKSAEDENALPCARSLVAQGFNPEDVSTWGETGGIPEEAVPFILEHYGITASSPSDRARAVLLAFSRVGVNAYLKERLGVSQARDTQPKLSESQQNLDWLMSWSQRWGVSFDDRDLLQIKAHAMSLALPPAGGAQQIYNDIPLSRAIYDLFRVVLETRQLSTIGRRIAAVFRSQFGKDPAQHDQYVDGANRSVAHYDRDWLVPQLERLYHEEPSLFERKK